MPDPMSRDPEVVALMTVIHNLRWCKSNDLLHAIAHDEEDEDGYRREFLTALHVAGYRVVAEGEEDPGWDLDGEDGGRRYARGPLRRHSAATPTEEERQHEQ